MSAVARSGSESIAIEVSPSLRWEVYRRLQTLGLTCGCESDRPLTVCTDTPLGVLQTWSVVRQMTAPRSQLVDWLQTCWHLPDA